MAQIITLDDLAHRHGTDKGTRPVASGLSPKFYTVLYEELFSSLRNESLRLLEVGIAKGYSLRMWEEYFPNARIFGLDINPQTAITTDRITSFIGNQADLNFVGAILAQLDPLDIIIDDGGHKREQQTNTFKMLWRTLMPGGFYAIEDLQADHTPPERDPLVTAIHDKLFYTREWPTEFNVERVYFFPRLIVLQKRKY